MNAQNSIQMLGKWLSDFRLLDDDQNTREEQVQEHLDNLPTVITSMAMDYELAGLDSAPLQALAKKQTFLSHRMIGKRFEVVDELMVFSARLTHQLESQEESQGWIKKCDALESCGFGLKEHKQFDRHVDELGVKRHPTKRGYLCRKGVEEIRVAYGKGK